MLKVDGVGHQTKNYSITKSIPKSFSQYAQFIKSFVRYTWFTPCVSQFFFWFFSIWLVIMTSFSFLIRFPIKLPLIVLKHSVLSKLIYPLLIPPKFCSNYYNPLLYFLSVCQCLTLLTTLSFDDSNWLRTFLSSLILFCNILLHTAAMGISGSIQQCQCKCHPMFILWWQKKCCRKGFHICGLSFQVLQCCW